MKFMTIVLSLTFLISSAFADHHEKKGHGDKMKAMHSNKDHMKHDKMDHKKHHDKMEKKTEMKTEEVKTEE